MKRIFQHALDWLGWERLSQTINRYHNQIMNEVSKLNERLTAIESKLEKASTEITGEISKLREQLANTQIPDDAVATLGRLADAAQKLDDIVPDAPAEPAPENPQG